jgi:hypothetical protein
VPRYFFDTYDQDRLSRDEEGLDCGSRSQLERNAIDALPDMAREALPDGPNHEFRVEVRDGQGRVVFRAWLKLTSEWLDGGPDGNG